MESLDLLSALRRYTYLNGLDVEYPSINFKSRHSWNECTFSAPCAVMSSDAVAVAASAQQSAGDCTARRVRPGCVRARLSRHRQINDYSWTPWVAQWWPSTPEWSVYRCGFNTSLCARWSLFSCHFRHNKDLPLIQISRTDFLRRGIRIISSSGWHSLQLQLHRSDSCWGESTLTCLFWLRTSQECSLN